MQRTLLSGARRSRASPTEVAHLEAAGIRDPLMQGYAVWRRSLLLVAIPFSVLSSVLAIRDVAERDLDGYSVFGVVAVYLVALAVPLLTVTVIVAALTWSRLRLSGGVLLVGWAISMLAPLVVAVLPLEWLLASSFEDVIGLDENSARIVISIQYAILLLPSLLSLPSGLVRGATRVKTMLPASTIAGWVLVIMAPVYAVFFVLALILVEHLAGNTALLIGITLLALTPIVHLASAKLYVMPLSTEQDLRRLDRVQRWAGVVGLAGLTLIVIWALTATIGDRHIVGGAGDALLDHLSAVLSALELVARVLVTSAVFSYVLLVVTESAWRHDRAHADPEAYERHELQMAEIERSLHGADTRSSR